MCTFFQSTQCICGQTQTAGTKSNYLRFFNSGYRRHRQATFYKFLEGINCNFPFKKTTNIFLRPNEYFQLLQKMSTPLSTCNMLTHTLALMCDL